MADVIATEKTSNSITLKIVNLDPNWNNQTDGGREIYFYFEDENGNITLKRNKLTHPKDESGDDITNTETVEYAVSNLKSSMTYQITLEIYKTGNDSYLLTTLYGTATTYPRAPKIDVDNVGTDSMHFQVYDNPFDSSGEVIRGNIYGFNITITGNDGSILEFGDLKASGGINNFNDGTVYAQGYNLNYAKYNIHPNTTYRIRIYSLKELADGTLYYNADNYSNAFFVTPDDTAPEKFYWSSHGSIPEAGSEISNISHTAWNAFVDAIDNLIAYDNGAHSGYMPNNSSLYGGAGGLEYSEATRYARVDGSDRVLYAYKFNIANYIIEQISGYVTHIDGIQSKDDCYASYLIALQDNYNKNL